MITSILANVLATGVLLTSSVASTAPIQPADVHFTFTQVLPAEKFVAHSIKKGETLEQIAHAKYGDEAYWTTLWNDNQWVEDPNDLQEGLLLQIRVEKPETPDEHIAKLTVPEEEEIPAEAAVAVAPVSPTPTAMPTTVPATSATPAQSSVVAAPVTYEEVYKQAGEKYGVPWQVLYGLHMTESGGRDGAISSGRGPQGPMQFMPGTWKAYGVDGNGDGTADINSAVDAIHGAANYLAKHGSLDQGLRSYGGNTAGTLAHAREKGFTQ